MSPVQKSAACPDVVRPAADYPSVVARLSQLSVRKQHDPFRDIPWDDPEFAIEPGDPRFLMRADEPLAATAWYRALSPRRRADFGLAMACQTLKFGIAFENAMSLGLLELLRKLPNRDVTFRYGLHALIEECKHSLMFQTFIDRSPENPRGLPWLEERLAQRLARTAPHFPEVFFCAVLAGEIFIDWDNRQRLAQREPTHPLLARILRIHVTEEARHLRFCESYLTEHLPRISGVRRALLRAQLPSIMNVNARLMLQPSRALVRSYRIPRAALREAFGPGSAYRSQVQEIAAPAYALVARAWQPPAALLPGGA